MTKTYNIDYFLANDAHFHLSKNSGQPVMYINAVGPNNCIDSVKKAEIWDFYHGKCDSSILSALMQNGEVYCYFATDSQAFDSFSEWFPQKSDLSDEEMDYYIYARIINVSTGVDVVNGNEKV
jgi:hypothetical protein